MTLQSLQQLIQWIADLVLNLLVRLPAQRMQVKSSGVSSKKLFLRQRKFDLKLIFFFFLVRTAPGSESFEHSAGTSCHHTNVGIGPTILSSSFPPQRGQYRCFGIAFPTVVEIGPIAGRRTKH